MQKTENIHHRWGGKGWRWGNCRLFVQARQCCVCLLLRSLASWLPLHCHRTGIMGSLAVREKSTTFSCAPLPSLILVCLSTVSLSQQHHVNALTQTHSWSCAAGHSAAPLKLLGEFVAFLTLMAAAGRLEGGCYSCLFLSRFHSICAGEAVLPRLFIFPQYPLKGRFAVWWAGLCGQQDHSLMGKLNSSHCYTVISWCKIKIVGGYLKSDNQGWFLILVLKTVIKAMDNISMQSHVKTIFSKTINKENAAWLFLQVEKAAY